ncbi:TMV resistance protein N-like [Pistacia vera]|uniref:TMV resistance protein N-like n=1 Tax=Pistacia vera TaxID=55513 RepID=UPI0012631C3F|nr:TMV resistance protein N-like [Pistacia vera]XP_031261173.1 TMV resistance protein N-like [Pistacia vera]XP_031261245.1 TMV resistance protein N-like [Pistacia vera]XP_031261302.1 TMV resistance protein N-like [Pistacia vera]
MSIEGAFSHTISSMWKYDVFLSFRGEDTRTNFTDHLHAALKKSGINVFKDDVELEKGKSTSPELSKAIEESRISIIVFSRNYASSTWCLNELVKIVQCMMTMKHMVIPIFYDVDPSVVRKQTGTFQEAFSKHEETFRENMEKVQKWRTALTEVANLSGWCLKDRLESKFIEEIVDEISRRLNPTTLMTGDDLVGLNSRLTRLLMLMSTSSNDVRMIGICGMGGIGKTTIARAVYDSISCEFEGSSFLANVREISEKRGLLCLQKQLISNILRKRKIKIWNVHDGIKMIRNRLRTFKILVVIDDVDNINQLNELTGKHDWFGRGSRIIITTRDKHLLMAHGVDYIYEAEKLDDNEALQLFNLKAFKNYQPPKEYEQLSKHVLKYASGLPLALEVLGSFLFGRTTDEWESALERLGRDSEKRILDILQISFDGLNESEKKIFLDVACFFKRKNKDHVTRILDSCGFDPTIGISVLVDKSLLTISNDNELLMHDLLKEMGHQIVKRESLEEPGKRSRLWEKTDISHVLTKNTGTEVVESIILEKEAQLSVDAKVFSKMIKLRLLKIHNLQLPQGLEYLSNELSFLEWNGYSLKSLPSSLLLDKTVELIMHYSRIEQLWKEIIQPLDKLKVISLSHSKNLNKTFPQIVQSMESLVELCLDRTPIKELPFPVEHLKGIVLLSMEDCKNLVTLPTNINDLKSLKTLSISGCSKLENVPENLGQVENLEKLDVSGTAIRRPTSSIFSMKNLKELSFRGCKGPPSNSWYLPFPFNLMSGRRSDPIITLKLPSLSGLPSLTNLDLSDCNLEEIPSEVGNLVSLQNLYLGKNNFVSLPSTINRLPMLMKLRLNNCHRLQSLPELPPNLQTLNVNYCASLKRLPNALQSCMIPYRAECICCRNCLKLSDYKTSVPSTPKELPNPIGEMTSIVIPGTEVPKWFSHQSEGSSIRIKCLPDMKLKGFFVTAVHFIQKHFPALIDNAYLRFRGNQEGENPNEIDLRAEDNYFQGTVSDHLWLIYIPIRFFCTVPHKYFFEFEFDTSGCPAITVSRCAAHPIYEEEFVEFDHPTEQCSSSISENNDHNRLHAEVLAGRS